MLINIYRDEAEQHKVEITKCSSTGNFKLFISTANYRLMVEVRRYHPQKKIDLEVFHYL